MKFISLVILYFITALFILQGWVLAAMVAIITFSFLVSPGYLIVLAILIDGYMGSFNNIPLLSLLSVVWFAAVEFIKPQFFNFKDS